MTKQEFFNKSKDERKTLIDKAHIYYLNNTNTSEIKDIEVKEFIEMCNEERNKQEKLRIELFN